MSRTDGTATRPRRRCSRRASPRSRARPSRARRSRRGSRCEGATSQNLEALFTYRASARTIDCYGVSYTCRGKKPVDDYDVYTITDGDDDYRRLATVRSGGAVGFNLRGEVSRYTEDGQRARGASSSRRSSR